MSTTANVARIGLDVQQRGARITGRAAHRLSQRRRGQERRNQHDVLDLASRQRVAQFGRFLLVTPCHAGRPQLVAGLVGAFAGAQNCRDHLIGRAEGCRVFVVGDREVVLIDGGAVGVFPLDQHHADRRGRHRHAEYGVHKSSLLFASRPRALGLRTSQAPTTEVIAAPGRGVTADGISLLYEVLVRGNGRSNPRPTLHRPTLPVTAGRRPSQWCSAEAATAEATAAEAAPAEAAAAEAAEPGAPPPKPPPGAATGPPPKPPPGDYHRTRPGPPPKTAGIAAESARGSLRRRMNGSAGPCGGWHVRRQPPESPEARHRG